MDAGAAFLASIAFIPWQALKCSRGASFVVPALQNRRAVPRESRSTPGLATLPCHVRRPLVEVAPAQRDQLRHPPSAIAKEADQGVVARPILDRLKQCESPGVR